MKISRYFGLIPAAGRSQRMGAPKLLLPVAGKPLIAWTVAAWKRSGVNRVLVVVRPDDVLLAEAARAAEAEVVIPSIAPPDMKCSVQAALRHMEAHYAPQAEDAFLVAPADMPRLSAPIIDRLIEQHPSYPTRILAPTVSGKRGHPVLVPWSLAHGVFHLQEHEGLSALVDSSGSEAIECADLLADGEQPFADIDTPAHYQRLIDQTLPGQGGY